MIRFLWRRDPARYADQNLIEMIDDTLADGVTLCPNPVLNFLREPGKRGFRLELSWVRFVIRQSCNAPNGVCQKCGRLKQARTFPQCTRPVRLRYVLGGALRHDRKVVPRDGTYV